MDNTLTYKYHCEKINSLITKLANSKWGANPTVVKTFAQVRCFSSADYASLNETCRIAIGCMKLIPIGIPLKAAGFTSPNSRRKDLEHIKMLKQTFDVRHSMFGQECGLSRLKFRRRFLSYALHEPLSHYLLREHFQTVFLLPEVSLTASELGWLQLNPV